jgi:Capsule assembly protein Wzi
VLLLEKGSVESAIVADAACGALDARAGAVCTRARLRPVRAGSRFSIVRSLLRLLKRIAVPLLGGSALAGGAHASGPSAYLPLNLEPEIERQIERVLILADEPVLKRPFPVELVRVALPAACKRDQALCERVGRYLDRYERGYGVTHASGTVAATHGASTALPNEHGLRSTDDWELSAQGYAQPSEYLIASAGVIAYSGRTDFTGSMLTAGFNWAQLDVGYRDHWLSPLTDSSSLLSTEAPTRPSVTLSNWEPFTRLGIQYEFIWQTLAQTDSDSPPGNNILYNGVASRGDPHLMSMQLSIEPFAGWSFGVNRNLEYGGGSGLPSSASFLLRDFFRPSGLSQTQGNQQASYVGRFIYPGRVPFALYFQYAGEDNSDGGSYLLGNAAMAAGIDFPHLGNAFDATYEVTEWQNIWYVHNIFLDGMTSNGLVLGNWGADQRNFGDGVGARSQMLRLGWQPPLGGYLQARLRTLANQSYYGGDSRIYSPGNPPPYPYFRYYDFTLSYSHPWQGLTIGAEATIGRDVDGQSFSRLAGFLRLGEEREHGGSYYGGSDDEEASSEHGAELFADAGVNLNRVRTDINGSLPITTSPTGSGGHFALGARRAVSQRNDLGMALELDAVDGHSLIGWRVVDYRYRFSDSFAAGLFTGVDRFNLETPAYSIYFGTGVQWRNFVGRWLPNWDLGLDYRFAQNVARDHVLPSDPQTGRPESFYKISSAVLYLERHF